MSNKPLLIFAHRGAKDLAPENTLSAFEKALQLGADGIETDVLITADHIPVLCHNNELRLLSSHQGSIHRIDYHALKNIDIGSHFGSRWSHERIPSLQAALELFANSNVKIVLEVKKQAVPTTQAIASIHKMVQPFLGKVDM